MSKVNNEKQNSHSWIMVSSIMKSRILFAPFLVYSISTLNHVKKLRERSGGHGSLYQFQDIKRILMNLRRNVFRSPPIYCLFPTRPIQFVWCPSRQLEPNGVKPFLKSIWIQIQFNLYLKEIECLWPKTSGSRRKF